MVNNSLLRQVTGRYLATDGQGENAWLLEEQPKSADQAKQEPSPTIRRGEKATAELRQGWNDTTIVLFFVPQVLEWIGFALLPIPFFVLLLKKRQTS